MSIRKFKLCIFHEHNGLLLLFTSMAWAQDEPSECVETGAHGVSITGPRKMPAGRGMPDGEANADYFAAKPATAGISGALMVVMSGARARTHAPMRVQATVMQHRPARLSDGYGTRLPT